MIIVGLGNPGQKYDGTRHNVGFRIVELLASQASVNWKAERQVEWAKIGSHWLIKPQSYMNESGSALKDFLSYKKIAFVPAEVIVVHDELDFEPGVVKIQTDRSSAGHNGVESIIATFGTQEFARLRFGIGSNRTVTFTLPAEDYVLQHFSAEENKVLIPAIDVAVQMLEQKLS